MFAIKDTNREKEPSNITQALTKGMNRDIWVVSTSNQLFIKSPLTQTNRSKFLLDIILVLSLASDVCALTLSSVVL